MAYIKGVLENNILCLVFSFPVIGLFRRQIKLQKKFIQREVLMRLRYDRLPILMLVLGLGLQPAVPAGMLHRRNRINCCCTAACCSPAGTAEFAAGHGEDCGNTNCCGAADRCN